MRTKRVIATLLAAVFAVAGCSGRAQPKPQASSALPLVVSSALASRLAPNAKQHIIGPPGYVGTTDKPAAVRPLVSVLSEIWPDYFRQLGITSVVTMSGSGSADVLVVASKGELVTLCPEGFLFDPNGSVVSYCRAPIISVPPALRVQSNLHSAYIVVPAGSFTGALQAVRASDSPQAMIDAALVMAFFYARHIEAQFAQAGLGNWEPASWAQMCLTGVGLGMLVPADITDSQRRNALAFLHQFWPSPQTSREMGELYQGYLTLNPKVCFGV